MGTTDASQPPARRQLRYQPLLARELVFNWSAWISTKYKTPKGAWHDIFENVTSTFEDEVGIYVRPWTRAWSRWDDGALGTSSEDAFTYIDRLEKQDQLISKSEFSTAFGFAATELAMFPYCVWLHKHFANSSQAWEVVAQGRDLNKTRWGLVWFPYKPSFNFTKPSANESFLFLDADDNGILSRTEFESVFEYCNSTAPPRQNSSNSSQPWTFTTVSTTTHPTTTSTSTSHEPTHCCAEVSARCLSCIAGISAQELCSRNSMSLIPGCKGPAESLHVQAAPGGPDENSKHTTTPPAQYGEDRPAIRSRECPEPGVAFTPGLSGQVQSREDGVAACQARCVRTLGCGYFTYWRNSSCELHPIDASCLLQSQATGGPAVCAAQFQARIASVAFSKLLKSQLGSLYVSLPEVLARHFGTPVTDVRDVDGTPGTVTLLPGSLLVEGKVLLPVGTAVRDEADRSAYDRSGELRRNVAKALLAAEVPYAVGGDGVSLEAVPLTMDVTADSGCFMEGVEFLSHHQDIAADTATECQTMCRGAENCTVFSFYRATNRCLLTRADASAASSSKAAVSGPARCAFIPDVSARDAAASGADEFLAMVHESSWFYYALAGLFVLLVVVLTCLGCWCERKQKRQRRKNGNYYDKALYMPITSDEGDEGQQRGAREVSRDLPRPQPD
ncbi:unnamed protein product [Symbiodinium sp. CCMP2592]|nr:unnamed protein product [Symbiodinium sp. CCMP2592]